MTINRFRNTYPNEDADFHYLLVACLRYLRNALGSLLYSAE